MNHYIHVGCWKFYPAYFVAQNTHNGTWAMFHETASGWACSCMNVPAQYMLKDLCDWFAVWITGAVGQKK